MQKKPSFSLQKKATEIPAAQPRPVTDFPVIGIGASAGGLEAIELFLKHVKTPCGMAFVIVQHLDPTHKGIMVELLQRVTSLDRKSTRLNSSH